MSNHDKDKASKEVSAQQLEEITVLAEGAHFNGIIENARELRINGSFKGTIRCEKVLINASATVEAEILAAEIVKVCGHLKGNVQARKILIFKGATIEGELHGEEIGMQPGANIRGALDSAAVEGVSAIDTVIPAPSAKEVPNALSNTEDEAYEEVADAFGESRRKPFLVAASDR